MAEFTTLDSHTIHLMALRWVHFVAGIIWIGLLYFFNFINGPFGKTMDADTKKKVIPQLMPRALWWFRWGAMFTFLSGWGYVFYKVFIATDAGFFGTGGLFTSTWGKWISLGGLFGTIMWFNVWFIIWPAQKKLISWTKQGQSNPEAPALTSRALTASRINTYLSVPLLFFMAGASHFPSFNWPTAATATVIGFAAVWFLITKISGKAGANF